MEVLAGHKIGIKEIKELTCWKFLIVFNNKTSCDDFIWSKIKDWFGKVRKLDVEDLLIERKLVVEVRGLPLHSWSEKN